MKEKRHRRKAERGSLSLPRKRSLPIFIRVMSLEWVGMGPRRGTLPQLLSLGNEYTVMGSTGLGGEYQLLFPNRSFDLTGISFLECSFRGGIHWTGIIP